MIVIKILFILMLLLPIAVLMRYLLQRLSSEVSAQTDSEIPVGTKMTSAFKKSDQEKGNGKMDAKGKQRGKGRQKGRFRKKSRGQAEKERAEAAPAAGGIEARTKKGNTYTPRQPQRWQRSERVPFGESEGYHVDPPRNRRSENNPDAVQWKKPSDALRERSIQESREGIRTTDTGHDPSGVDKKGSSKVASGTQTEENTRDKKRKNRSDKSPSKRQLRKNRERARKRDMKKRKKEQGS